MSESSRFLARWARLKKAAESVSVSEIPDGEALLAQLGPDSDFGQFLRQEISEEVRRTAMKTLFADPRFNVMDGLDIYIDDYSISDPIPEAMLASLNQVRTLFGDPADEPAPEAVPEVVELVPAESAAGCDILVGEGQNVAEIPADRIQGEENQ